MSDAHAPHPSRVRPRARPARARPRRPAFLDHAPQQYRACFAGRDRPRPAHGRRRHDVVRAGRVLRLRRVHHGDPDDELRLLAMAEPPRRPRRNGGRRRAARVDHGPAVGPLPAARDPRLGHQPLFPVRQDRHARPPRRHNRRAAPHDRPVEPDRPESDLLGDLGGRAARRDRHHESSVLAGRPRDSRASARRGRRRSPSASTGCG